jgi:hypothetical protein
VKAVKKFEHSEKNPKDFIFFLNFFFFIATNHLLLKSKTTSILVGFCGFEHVFCKN